jgi:maltose O-acetyltransferase
MTSKHKFLGGDSIYWLAILLANWNGHIGIHSIRHFCYRNFYKVKLPKSSIIYTGCRFFAPWGISLGNNSIIGDHCFLDGRHGLKIGNNVNIGGDVMIFTREHDITSPTFEGKGAPVTIEDWAYVASRAMILPGVTIGEGAVVAAGAVVTKDVSAWTMVCGIPAEFKKNRPVVKYTLDTKSKALFQ